MDNLEEKVANLEDRINLLEKAILKKESNLHSTNKETQKKQSIREFLSCKDLDGDTQKTLAIAYFFEVSEKKGSFNADDLKSGFADAKFKAPSNINDRVNQNIKLGYIMDADEKKDSKKSWVLTDTGEKEVENNLNKENEQ